MTFADQRLKMAGNAGPSVRQGWQVRATLSGDLGPDTLPSKDFEKNGVRNTAVNDVGLADALFESIKTRMHFRQHALRDRTFFDHPLNIFPGDSGEMAPLGIANTFDVGHHH